MKLLTKAIEKKLLANAAKADAGNGYSAMKEKPVVKFFNPAGAGTWLAVELHEGGLLFGLADIGMGYVEAGYFSLDELKAFKGPFGLGIERDMYFSPDKSLGEYKDEAGPAGEAALAA